MKNSPCLTVRHMYPGVIHINRTSQITLACLPRNQVNLKGQVHKPSQNLPSENFTKSTKTLLKCFRWQLKQMLVRQHASFTQLFTSIGYMEHLSECQPIRRWFPRCTCPDWLLHLRFDLYGIYQLKEFTGTWGIRRCCLAMG